MAFCRQSDRLGKSDKSKRSGWQKLNTNFSQVRRQMYQCRGVLALLNECDPLQPRVC
jgi:hypothetical protein